jgi:arylsulfatase A-like enzyme
LRFAGDWAAEFASYPDTPDAAYGDFGEMHAAEARRHYYANISFIDDQVGSILAALRKKGFLDHALVLFTSDHGDMLGDHFHWRKTYPYQGSAHVPFLMQWPAAWTSGVARGCALAHPVELRDVLPTFLDAAGADIPSKMDGRSLLNLIRNPNAAWRPAIDLEHAQIYRPGNYWGGLTDGRIKYVWFYPDGREQLFDLAKDPGEQHDASGDAAYREMLEAWRARFAEHLAERGEGFVKGARPAVRKENLLYSPFFPADEPPSR